MTREPPTSADGGMYFLLDHNRKPKRVGIAAWRAQQATRAVVLADDKARDYRIVTRFPGTKLGMQDGESLWFVTLSGNVPVARAATYGEALRTHRLIVEWLRRNGA